VKILEKLEKIQKKNQSLVCVGLDSDREKLPGRFQQMSQPQFEFNKWVINQTVKQVCAYKPNLAFYEAYGEKGWRELRLTIEYVREKYPEIVTIADAKRGDIGSTNQGYVKAIFDDMGFDGVTLSPYLGEEALKPFLERTDKACIILGRTSNPGGGEMQDLIVETGEGNKKLWQVVAEKVSGAWNRNGNVMLVAGATYPEELKEIRKIIGEMTLLVPGVGAQGGDLERVVANGVNSKGLGLIINSSRGIIFSDNPGDEVRTLKEQINSYRDKK